MRWLAVRAQQFRENLLVTHRGLSGPAILQISSYWQPGAAIHINLLPEHDAAKLLSEQQNREIELGKLPGPVSAAPLCPRMVRLNSPSQPLKRFTPASSQTLPNRLNHWEIVPAGTEGYRKAEVTAGGVATDELSSQTMEAKKGARTLLHRRGCRCNRATGWL